MKVDEMCAEPDYETCVEIFCSDYPEGVRCAYDSDCLYSFEPVWPMGECNGDDDYEDGEPPYRTFWAADLLDVLKHYREVRIRFVPCRVDLKQSAQRLVKSGGKS